MNTKSILIVLVLALVATCASGRRKCRNTGGRFKVAGKSRTCKFVTKARRRKLCRKGRIFRKKCRRSCGCRKGDLDSDLQMTQHEDVMMEDDALVDEMMEDDALVDEMDDVLVNETMEDDALVDEMDYVLVNETMEDALVEE